MMRTIVYIATCLGSELFSVSAQSPSPELTGPVLDVTAREVLLDIVVNDKKKRPVNNLRSSEIEVYEDVG